MAQLLDTYLYDPLPNQRSIRLIELLPSPDDIQFNLHIFELVQSPPFDAISYTWGDSSSPYLDSTQSEDLSHYNQACYPTLCNGFTLMIRRNLNDAFNMLRKLFLGNLGNLGQKYIWIDAICIDQSNTAERETQVGLMGALYSAATNVIAWIGPEDTSTPDALTVIERISSVTLPSTECDMSASDELARLVTQQDFITPEAYREKLGIEPLTTEHWLAWVTFFIAHILKELGSRRKYYLRDPSSGFLMLSRWNIQLHTEYLRKQVVKSGNTGMYQKLLSHNLDPGFGAVTLTQARLGMLVTERLYQFHQLLDNHRHCEASDPRDMVYAMLGISRRDKPPLIEYGHLLKPDYHISVEGLYTKVTRLMLRSNKDLSFLSYREGNYRRSLKRLPSWVPDLSVSQTHGPLRKRGPACNWCAQGSQDWKEDKRNWTDPLLDVRGLLVGEVSAVTYHEMFSEWSWLDVYKVVSGLEEYYRLSSKPDLDNQEYITQLQTRVEVMWRTLITDTFLEEHPAPAETGKQFMAHLITMTAAAADPDTSSKTQKVMNSVKKKLFRAAGKYISEKREGAWLRLVASEPSTSRYDFGLLEKVKKDLDVAVESCTTATEALPLIRPFYAQYREELSLCMGERQVFTTDGGLLGLGPIDTKIGDEVWVLAGSPTPFVLRPSETGNRVLLGEAYVHGAMHGELADSPSEWVDLILE